MCTLLRDAMIAALLSGVYHYNSSAAINVLERKRFVVLSKFNRLFLR